MKNNQIIYLYICICVFIILIFLLIIIYFGIKLINNKNTSSSSITGKPIDYIILPPEPTLQETPVTNPPEPIPQETPQEIPDEYRDCKLPIVDAGYGVSIGGFPRYPERLKSTGRMIAKVIFVDFPNSIATITPQQAFAKISMASNLVTEMSYGKLELVMEPMYKWYRMSKNGSSYAPLNESFQKHKAYISEALDLSNSDIDFKNVEFIIIIANPDTVDIGMQGPTLMGTFSNGFNLDNKFITNVVTSAHDLNNWGFTWLNHEMGHSLGLPDLYTFKPDSPGNRHPFVGEFSLMGVCSSTSNSPGFFAWERWLLNWLEDTQIKCLNNKKSGTYLITPIERNGGVKAITVPLTRTKSVVIESRRPEGIDKNLAKSGALVYVVDSTIQTGSGPIKVYPLDLYDSRKVTAIRAQGETVTVENIKITVKTSNNEGDLVEIIRL
jgi:M6 family metalloprotease-like protein